MDSQQPTSSQPSVKKVLVKRVKVLVKRPVAAAPSAAAPQQTTMIKVPVKRVVSAAQPAQPTPAQPAAQTSASGRPSYIGQVINGVEVKPLVYELPDNIYAAVTKYKKLPQKILAFYMYSRIYAERVAQQNGRQFPPMLVDLPQDNLQLAEFIHNTDGGDLLDSIFADIGSFAPFVNGLERIVTSQLPLEKVLPAEKERLRNREIKYAEQIILAYLDILIDFGMIHDKLELKAAQNKTKRFIKAIQKAQKDEEEVKKRFIKAIEKKKFPVDAKKLITNYFTLAKKEPEKAYETLITNPMFFSPIEIERMPKGLFGLSKPSPKDAAAINKQLASFLKHLKA